MMKLRPAHLVLGALTLAAASKIGSFGGGPADPAAGTLPPEIAAFSLVGPAAAAGSPEPEAEPEPMAKPQACEMPEAIFAEITRERGLLAGQSEALLQREAEIQLAQEKLAIEAEQLNEYKAALEALLARVQAAQNEDLDRLVNLYRNMKPKDAAGIIGDLDIEVSVLVFAAMAERDAAPILANIDPVRARAITKIIFERSKLPGDQDFSGIRLQ